MAEEAPAEAAVAEEAPAAVVNATASSSEDAKDSSESYVETVAKDLSSERKGGLAKLF